MRGRQVLWQIELPVAMPLIMAGIRTSTVRVVATATLAAYVGLGGLGRCLFDGLPQRDLYQVLGGAVWSPRSPWPPSWCSAAYRPWWSPRAWPSRVRMRPSAPRSRRPHGPGRQGPSSQGKDDRSCEGSGSAAPRWRPAWLLWPPAAVRRMRWTRATQPNEQSSVTVGSTNPYPSSSSWPRCTPPCSRRPVSTSRSSRTSEPGRSSSGPGRATSTCCPSTTGRGAVLPQPRGHRDHRRGGQHRPHAAAGGKGLVA